MEIFQNYNNYVDTAANIDASIMKESAEMTSSQLAKTLINHATETTSKLGAEIMEQSAAMVLLQSEMARSQPYMGLINHATGYVNAVFGGRGGVVG